MMKRSHYLRRYQMELNLETMPREVYSNKLIDAMRREEILTRDGNAVPAQTIKAIDDMLKSETEKFYRRITTENAKRWASLKKKLSEEIRGLQFQDQDTKTNHMKATDGETENGDKKSSVESDRGESLFERELLRLEEDYNRDWLKYEGRNLKTAFIAQMGRVEADWNAHEASLVDDFNRRKISEKIGHNRMKEGAAQRQLSMSLESLQRQKEAAKRWMTRQELRLQAQASETAKERAAIAELLSDQEQFSL